MEVLTGMIIAAVASVFAALSKAIISRIWESHASDNVTQKFTITTNSGNRIIVESDGKLSQEQVREIVANVASQSK